MSTSTIPTAVSAPQLVWLVAERELLAKLRSKAFLISTGILFVIALAGIIFSGLAAQNTSGTAVAVAQNASSLVAGIPGLDITPVADRDAAVALVKSGAVSAGIVAGASGGLTVIGMESVSNSLLMQLAVLPHVELLDPSPTDGLVRYFVALGFGIVFMMAAMMFGTTIAQSVVEEKQTRVVEILISAMPTRALLAGKVIGNTILAMGQIIGLAAIATIGLSVTGQGAMLSLLGVAIAWFAVFFLFGFVLLAALFAGAAAMVSRQEDIGSVTTPLTMLVMLPYVLIIVFNDNSTVLTIMSYVPFTAAVGMPMRLFLGEALWWEPLLSLGILLVSCVLAVMIGAKIYDNTLLRMGARVKWSEALKR